MEISTEYRSGPLDVMLDQSGQDIEILALGARQVKQKQFQPGIMIGTISLKETNC